MKLNKVATHKLEKCYSITTLEMDGDINLLVAAEKTDSCLLFSEDCKLKTTVWDGPGGVMTMCQIPGSEGEFLATQKFYSPNDSKEAVLVHASPDGNGGFKIKTVADLPFVHRFDILISEGVKYIIACTLKSGHKEKDDWSSPGKIVVCKLPDFSTFADEDRLQFTAVCEGVLKNHGYCRRYDGENTYSVVGSESGIFEVKPPQNGNDWQVKKICEDKASDMAFADVNGDGVAEMITISDFHGEKISIYEKTENGYAVAWKYEKELPFAHSIFGGNVKGKECFIIGNRGGEKDITAFYYDGEYKAELLDTNAGSANVLLWKNNKKTMLISTNREIDEIAFYDIEV